MVGRKAIAHFLAEDFTRLFVRDVEVTFHGLHADGDRVIVEETMTSILANGNHYANDYCLVFELRDGLRSSRPAADLHQLSRIALRHRQLQLAATGEFQLATNPRVGDIRARRRHVDRRRRFRLRVIGRGRMFRTRHSLIARTEVSGTAGAGEGTQGASSFRRGGEEA
ncbi:nuclear transport factor 2 family protein [Amycolatopsis eburnea]|uniref:Nuclear transport factor 2 family protein n=2 Tax=Amycolatopsis eburnea TaxID=2267691 RepID=A0A3R9DHI2_9PSEU|nr:nuclear transport factor 2 family protein [Amycolatopsis eburnea]